jgi:uncharacterized protein YyaL (SSP411 family)
MLNQVRRPNRLIKEKSPYLLKHAYNPVDWYPWGEEAIKKAKNDSKPILLSIGYSSCHWCNVMEKESFENEEIASIINKNFIPVKVDREERPEIDRIYMSAVQAMTGNGGWPLTVFLTPDLKPFFGGTYFPPEPKYGMPGFKQVLEFVSKLWKEKREEVIKSSSAIMDAIKSSYETTQKEIPRREVFDEAFESLVSQYDDTYGGFGIAPKFPLPCSLNFLMLYHYRKKKELALSMVKNTLYRMCLGGIRDHVGGGFHRYSTDRIWMIPHFEKMLYDNALLSHVLLNAYRLTSQKVFLQTAREAIGWIITEMRNSDGGFYSAQDADTIDGEGYYYTWTPSEVKDVLGSDAEIFCRVYGITSKGNFEGRSIPNLVYASEEDIMMTTSERFTEMKQRLYSERKERNRPLTDDKIIVSWNGLAISALSLGYQVTGESQYLEEAERAASFIIQRMWDGNILKRVYREGVASLPGTLEDYSFFVQGLIDLYEASMKDFYIEKALSINDTMVQRLSDKDGGFFFDEENIAGVRLKESYDGPTPSGSSVAAMNLVRLSEITGRNELRDKAESVFSFFGKKIESDPGSHTWMIAAYDYFLNGMYQIVITAKRKEKINPMIDRLNSEYIPNMILVVADEINFGQLKNITSFLESREPRDKPLAYVCKGFSCLMPTDDPDVLVRTVKEGINQST